MDKRGSRSVITRIQTFASADISLQGSYSSLFQDRLVMYGLAFVAEVNIFWFRGGRVGHWRLYTLVCCPPF